MGDGGLAENGTKGGGGVSVKRRRRRKGENLRAGKNGKKPDTERERGPFDGYLQRTRAT